MSHLAIRKWIVLFRGNLDWWTFDDSNFRRAAKLIVAMFKKGWFDDAVGQVEGSEILRDLMTFGNGSNLQTHLYTDSLLPRQTKEGSRQGRRSVRHNKEV